MATLNWYEHLKQWKMEIQKLEEIRKLTKFFEKLIKNSFPRSWIFLKTCKFKAAILKNMFFVSNTQERHTNKQVKHS